MFVSDCPGGLQDGPVGDIQRLLSVLQRKKCHLPWAKKAYSILWHSLQQFVSQLPENQLPTLTQQILHKGSSSGFSFPTSLRDKSALETPSTCTISIQETFYIGKYDKESHLEPIQEMDYNVQQLWEEAALLSNDRRTHWPSCWEVWKPKKLSG